MAELVQCPKCEGTGTIKAAYPSDTPSAKAPVKDNNLAKFMKEIGMTPEKKQNPEFITCPQCNGYGYVRG